MKLSSQDIEYIRLCLRNKGLGYQSLQEELIDHIICEIEIEVEKGTPLKKAVDTIIQNVNPGEFVELQDNTIQSDNYTPNLMMRNIGRMLFRNLMKNKQYSIINLLGLGLGFACFITVSLYVFHENGYDKIFKDSSSIYRITMSSLVGGKNNHIPTSYPLIAPELQGRFGEVENYTRIINYKYSRLTPTFQTGDRIFYEENVIFADSTFFDLFDFQFREGNPGTALAKPTSVVITKRLAEKYFGDVSALGKHLTFNSTHDLEVTGVLENIPSNTHLQFDFIIPMTGLEFSGMFGKFKIAESWNADWFWTYFKISDSRAVPKIAEGINLLVKEKIPKESKEYGLQFYLQALTDVHLHSDFDYNTDLTQNGDIKSLYIFIGIAVLILLVSSINFINISIATATRRFKEIGVSKVLGALRSQLRVQFIAESVIVSLISLLLGYLILQIMLPTFNMLMNVHVRLNILEDWKLVLLSIVFAFLVGIFSGIYPALFISSFDPQKVLKGIWKPGSGGASFRSVLVGVQIVISIFLIVGTLVIYNQLGFIQNKSLGYDKEHIVMLPIRGTAIPRNYHVFKNKLLSSSAISSVSSVSEPIGREVQFMSFTVGDRPEEQFVKILNVTHDFAKTMGLEVIEGRDFSREFVTDSTGGFVINEAAAKSFGWDDPIGQPIDHSFRQVKQGKVIGVVKDFNYEPLQKKIEPIIIWFGGAYWYVCVRIQAGQQEAAIQAMEKAWREVEDGKPFAFHFLDQSIQHVYDNDHRLGNVFFAFSVLSILTAMMGLYGLVSFVVEQRLQEIGIRKVLGASVYSILNLMARNYILLVIISFILSAPLTYWIMNNWLEEFAFRIDLSPAYFGLGFIIILILVAVTVLSKVTYAAQRNPVQTLRRE